MFEVLTVSSGM